MTKKFLSNFCNAFLQAGLTDLDESWYDGRSYGVAGLKRFWNYWRTFVHFFGEDKFLIVDISGILNQFW